jgi:hypothetical protein
MPEVMDKPKNKGGRPRKIKPAVDGGVARAIVALPKDQEPETVYGWKVSEGFYRIMLFGNVSDGTKSVPIPFTIGEHPRTLLYTKVMHIVPGAIKNAILDTVQLYPEDDTSDPQHPVRNWVKHTDIPHSDPIPATWQEYKAYRDEMEKKPTASEYARMNSR